MRINYKVLIGILVALVVVGGGGFFVYQRQTRRNAERTLNWATNARMEGLNAEALELFRRYVALVPDDASAYAAMGNIYLSVGRPKEALTNLDSALRLDPDNLAVRNDIVRATMQLGRPKDALAQLNDHLIPATPEDAKLYWLKGRCLALSGKQEDGLAEIAKAFKREPSNPDYAYDFAALSLRDGESGWEKARQIIDQPVLQDPDNADAYQARARWLYSNSPSAVDAATGLGSGRIDQAWNDALVAIKLAPDNLSTFALLVDLATQLNRTDQLDAITGELIEKASTSPLAYRLVADLKFAQNDADAALKFIDRGLQIAPDNGGLLSTRVRAQMALEDLPGAEETLQQLKKSGYVKEQVVMLEAMLLSAQGDFRGAIARIQKSRASIRNDPNLERTAVGILSRCYAEINDRKKQIEVLEQAIADHPTWVSVRSELARALAASGKNEEALEEYTIVLNSPNAPAAALLSTASLLLSRSSGDDAERRLQQVRDLIKQFEDVSGASTQTKLLQADLLLREKRDQEARDFLEQLVTDEPTNKAAWNARLGLEIILRNWDEAERQLNRARKAIGDSPEMRLSEVNLLLARDGQQVDVEELERLAAIESTWEEDQTSVLLFDVAKVFFALGDLDRSRQLAERALEFAKNRSSRDIQLFLFDLESRAEDLDGLANVLSRIASSEGKDSASWRLGEAVRLTLKAGQTDEGPQRVADLEQALGHLAEAEILRAEMAAIPRVAGRALLLLGREKEAVESFQEAIELGETDPEFIASVVQLLYRQRRFRDADRLVRMIEANRISPSLARVASQLSVQLSDFKRAIQLAKDQADESGLAEDRIWLAQVYFLDGNREQSERELQSVLEESPAEPAALLSLVQMKLGQGDEETATRLVQDATPLLKKASEFVALGQAYELIGEYGKARQFYDEGKKSVEPNEQASLLRRIAEMEYRRDRDSEATLTALEALVNWGNENTDAAESDVAWARRTVATLLAGTSNEENLKKARDLVEQNIASSTATDADRRTLALIISLGGDEAALRKSIEMMERIVAGQENFSLPDRFALAKLYGAVGELSKCQSEMRDVISNGGAKERACVLYYADLLLRKEQFSEAELWIRRLRELSEGSNDAESLSARVLFGRGGYNRIEEFLVSRSKDPRRIEWCAQTAEILAEAIIANPADYTGEDSIQSISESLVKRSREWREKMFADDPATKGELLNFYARQGMVDTLLSEGLVTESEDFGRLGQILLQCGKVDAEQVKRLIEETKRYQNVVGIQLLRGDAHGWLGECEQAIAEYQSVLSDDAKNAAANNNLAFVLAHSDCWDEDRAVAAIESAINQLGELPVLLDTKGLVLIRMGKLDQAETVLNASVESEPVAGTLIHQAYVLQQKGENAVAEKAVEKARDAQPIAAKLHPYDQAMLDRTVKKLKMD